MHGDLARIKCAYSHGAECAAGTKPGNQSGAGIVHQVGATQTANKRSVVGTVELGMVQQIRRLSGNLQLESLGDRERSPQSEVNIGAAGSTKEPTGLGAVSIPVLIRHNTSVRSGQRLSSEGTRVVFQESILLRGDGFSAGQGHGCFSVVPMLEGLRNLHRLAWNSVHAGSDGSTVGHGNNKRYPALHGNNRAYGPVAEGSAAQLVAQGEWPIGAEGRGVGQGGHDPVRHVSGSIVPVQAVVEQVGSALVSSVVNPLPILDAGGGEIEFLAPGVVDIKVESGRKGVPQTRLKRVIASEA